MTAVLLPNDVAVIHSYFHQTSSILFSPSSHLTFYVGYLNDQPVSVASIYRDDISAGIWDIMTHPKSQRCKIGTTMMQAMIHKLKNEKYNHVVLTASDAGLPVYQKMGFHLIGHEYKVYNFC